MYLATKVANRFFQQRSLFPPVKIGLFFVYVRILRRSEVLLNIWYSAHFRPNIWYSENWEKFRPRVVLPHIKTWCPKTIAYRKAEWNFILMFSALHIKHAQRLFVDFRPPISYQCKYVREARKINFSIKYPAAAGLYRNIWSMAKFDSAITFDKGVLLTWGQHVCTAFWMILLGILHLTIFDALKWALKYAPKYAKWSPISMC